MSKLPGALCSSCPLNGEGIAVPGYGDPVADYIIVGEAPGVHEEIQGIPFVGQSGQLLDAAILAATLGQPKPNIFKTNVIACRPPGNREPSDEEIAACAPRLNTELRACTGRKILALGNTAQKVFNVPSSQKGAVFEHRLGSVMPAWHPAYVLRSPDEASDFLAQVERFINGPMKVELIPPPEIRWATSLDDLEAKLTECPTEAWVAFDIETDQTKWYDSMESPRDNVLMLQLAWCEEFVIIVSDELLYDSNPRELTRILNEFFARVKPVGHNAKFDAVFLASHFDIVLTQEFDTMLAHYALDENQAHGLKSIARLEFGMPDYEVDTVLPYLSSRNDRYSKVPAEVLAKYGGWDVVVTLKLREVFEGRLQAQGLYEWPFKNLLMRAANALTKVELRGFKVDVPHLDKLAAAFATEIADLTKQIQLVAEDDSFNPNSSVQMSALLYDKLGLPMPVGRKIKPRSTAHEALIKLKGKHPVIEIIGTLRRVSKMKSSYVDNILGFIDLDGRTHANFKIQGTEVGRLSVADPALQTIPRPDDYYGALIRSAFVASPGKVLLVADYSQAELRVFADQSSEPFLIRVYKDNRDLHSEVAIAMFGPGYTKAQRVQCKMFNFSYLYGGTEYSFAQDAGLDITIAKQFVANYNAMMPAGLAYKKAQLVELKKEGFVSSRFNRRRHFPLITNDNLDDARKACVHMPTAASASDLTLLSACTLVEEGIDVVLTVHDSVIVECAKEDAERIGARMVEVMQSLGEEYFPSVPWGVDLEESDRWAKLPEPR